jgi:hypothetical protein
MAAAVLPVDVGADLDLARMGGLQNLRAPKAWRNVIDIWRIVRDFQRLKRQELICRFVTNEDAKWVIT